MSSVYAQSYKLMGNIDICMNKGSIEEEIFITDFFTNSNTYEILLSKSLNIKSVYLNNDGVDFDIDTTNRFQNIYHLDLNKVSEFNDTLKLNIVGTFEIYNENHKYLESSNMNIVSNYGILRAPAVTSWYPQISSSTITELADMYTQKYNYDIHVRCADCEYIQIGDELPSKSPYRFKKAYGGIMLLAGNFKWLSKNNSVFINIDSVKINHLVKKTRQISTYYENLLNEPTETAISYAKIYTDKADWLFYGAPTIVFMKPKDKPINIDIAFLSHEIAHNYFGNLYVPKTNLYWFYLESFAEYYSFKYQISTNNVQELRNKYATLKVVGFLNKFFIKKINGYNINFVHLDKVKDKEAITEFQRYNISPFQLLGIEHLIGEDKMIAFTKKVFANLQANKDGYQIMLETLGEVGIDEKLIKRIEKDYFRRLKLRKYKFIKKNWRH